MSGYTPIAARLRAKYAPGTAAAPAMRDAAPVEANDDDLARAESIAEREAIAIIDGGLPAEWAAALAMLTRGPCPPQFSSAEWSQRLNALWARADEHGAAFAAAGWTFEEVFGAGDWRDEPGMAWRDPSARILSISPQEVVYALGRDQLTHRRPH